MAKKIKFDIVDNKVILTEDASKDDYIDLGDDTLKNKIINQSKPELEKEFEKEFKRENPDFLRYKKSYENLENEKDVIKLKTIEEFRKDKEYSDLKSSKEELTKLQSEYQNLKNSFEDKISLSLNEKEKQYKQQINDLNSKIKKERALQEQKDEADVNNFKLKLEKAKLESINEFKKTEEFISLKSAADKYNKNLSTMNSKVRGEDLEEWISNEYDKTIGMLRTAEFQKDNKVVTSSEETKGTKADFIFTIYNKPIDDETKEIISTTVIEAKTDSEETKNRKKNSDHLPKLEKDRQKKNGDYAILVTELELHETNNWSIKRDPHYPKIILVRPEFLISVLNLIIVLSESTINLKEALNRQNQSFKETDEIIEEFEKFKNGLLDNSLKHIETKLGEIKNSAEIIEKQSKKILDTYDLILRTHLSTVKNKLTDFKITKITKKIDGMEELNDSNNAIASKEFKTEKELIKNEKIKEKE